MYTHLCAHMHSLIYTYTGIYVCICTYTCIHTHKLVKRYNPKNTTARNRVEPRDFVSWEMQILHGQERYREMRVAMQTGNCPSRILSAQSVKDENLPAT